MVLKKTMEQLNALHEIQVNYTRSYGIEAIRDSQSAYEICKKAYSLAEANICLKEYFIIILLNRGNQVIGFYKLSEGGLSGTVADIRLAFSVALKCLASGMIISHCHPSGQLKPSTQDQKLTRQFSEAGKLIDIQVIDHLIVSTEDYYSFADDGQI
jgi:DNA repair protein RadC